MLVVFCNAPTTFHRMIDTVLDDLKWKTGIGYLDDVVIFLFTFIEHLQRLDEVLTCLSQASLQLIRKKCHFASSSIKVLVMMLKMKEYALILTKSMQFFIIPGLLVEKNSTDSLDSVATFKDSFVNLQNSFSK